MEDPRQALVGAGLKFGAESVRFVVSFGGEDFRAVNHTGLFVAGTKNREVEGSDYRVRVIGDDVYAKFYDEAVLYGSSVRSLKALQDGKWLHGKVPAKPISLSYHADYPWILMRWMVAATTVTRTGERTLRGEFPYPAPSSATDPMARSSLRDFTVELDSAGRVSKASIRGEDREPTEVIFTDYGDPASVDAPSRADVVEDKVFTDIFQPHF